MLPRSVTPSDYLAREWLSWVQIDQVVCLTLASHTCNELLLCLNWGNSAVDLYLDHHPRVLQVGWPTLRLSIDLCLEVIPQSGKGPNTPIAHVHGPPLVFFFFFKIGFFFWGLIISTHRFIYFGAFWMSQLQYSNASQALAFAAGLG